MSEANEAASPGESASEEEPERTEARARLAAADAQLEENPDGVIIVRLTRPVLVDGEELHRLTVQRVKVKHVRVAQKRDNEADFYADALVVPAGATGELESDADYTAVIRAVQKQLGKFRASGARS